MTMRVSTIIITAVVAGLCWIAWWVFDTVGAVAQVSGGSYGSDTASDSAIQSFVVLGLIAAPLTVWLIRAIAHESKSSASSEDNASQDTGASPPTA
ncbi:hypothetical protein ABNQ24_07010 [Ralstonia pseudosolanacearum]|uniref:hypothetical protein n=1 Tax=Ralstonia pseudosolanacearum TaxID=1310165 RepID=UPI00336ADD6F